MYSAMEWGSLALRRLRGVRRTKSLWMSALYVRLLCSPALGFASQMHESESPFCPEALLRLAKRTAKRAMRAEE
ncbi:MAG: hypothetical protein LBK04_00015 [Clostridiales Family XIII bacterium]|nr:hypothetical protein [Clostridiales Family XIII bacterium]